MHAIVPWHDMDFHNLENYIDRCDLYLMLIASNAPISFLLKHNLSWLSNTLNRSPAPMVLALISFLS